jgi:hypothetical protein
MQKMEQWVDHYTPESVKRFCARVVDLLPAKMGDWIRNNKGKSIIIFFTIRGLFFRPSMWLLYAAIFAYFQK